MVSGSSPPAHVRGARRLFHAPPRAQYANCRIRCVSIGASAIEASALGLPIDPLLSVIANYVVLQAIPVAPMPLADSIYITDRRSTAGALSGTIGLRGATGAIRLLGEPSGGRGSCSLLLGHNAVARWDCAVMASGSNDFSLRRKVATRRRWPGSLAAQ